MFSAFCPLRDGFIYHILSMGFENDLFYVSKCQDSIYSRMAIHTCTHIRVYIYIYIEREREREFQPSVPPTAGYVNL